MVEEFDMKMIFIQYTNNIQSLKYCFCYSWKLSKCSWILNPIQIRWIFNLISHQFIFFFLNENIYVQVDWMLIFLFTSYIFFFIIWLVLMKLLNLVVDKAESFSLMNEQNDYTKYLAIICIFECERMNKMIIRNIFCKIISSTSLFVFLNEKVWKIKIRKSISSHFLPSILGIERLYALNHRNCCKA